MERLRELVAKWRKRRRGVVARKDDAHNQGWAKGTRECLGECADELEAALEGVVDCGTTKVNGAYPGAIVLCGAPLEMDGQRVRVYIERED